MRCGVWCCFFTGGMVFAWPSYILLGSACVKKTVQCICSMHLMGHLQHGMFLLFTRTTTASSKNRNKSIRWYIQGNDWSDWTTNKWDPFEKTTFLCGPCDQAAMQCMLFLFLHGPTQQVDGVCVWGTIEIDCGYTKRMLYAGIPQP